MSAEIATIDRVRQAVATLRKKDVRVTADRVIELIGGGGKKTVLDHLRTLRTGTVEPDEVPPAVIELARAALGDIFQAGRTAEADRTRAATHRLASSLEDLDAQIQELSDANQNLEAEVKSLKLLLDQARTSEEESGRRLAAAEGTIVDLRAELASGRESAAADLLGALERFEALVEEASSTKLKRARTLQDQ